MTKTQKIAAMNAVLATLAAQKIHPDELYAWFLALNAAEAGADSGDEDRPFCTPGEVLGADFENGDNGPSFEQVAKWLSAAVRQVRSARDTVNRIAPVRG